MKTKFGNVKIHKDGYYRITSRKEGNKNKYLHHLIWEDFYDKPMPKGYVIHHINKDKLDNRIQNLQCVEHDLHLRFHNKGEKNPFYNKKHTPKTRKKMSKNKNTTGIMYVDKQKKKGCKQGFTWRYRYCDENGKLIKITRVNLDDLEQEVKKRGLPWIKIEID